MVPPQTSAATETCEPAGGTKPLLGGVSRGSLFFVDGKGRIIDTIEFDVDENGVGDLRSYVKAQNSPPQIFREQRSQLDDIRPETDS